MTSDSLLLRAKALKLHGLINHWDELAGATWVAQLLDWEEKVRSKRSLERRIRYARIAPFKPLHDFDWTWPKNCERSIIEDCMQLGFIEEAVNIILCGPNGVGKTTIAQNIAHEAVMQGHTVLFTTASEMLNELAAQDGDNALRRRIKHYAQPRLLVLDEVGYLSYGNRHADLMFEVISRRYQEKPTLITTNKPFAAWNDIFPNAACAVSLIDRLVHHSEIININAESYRVKEATEKSAMRKAARNKGKDESSSKKTSKSK